MEMKSLLILHLQLHLLLLQQFLICLLLIAAILSSFINNIGALAILLPITLNICQKMEWHPSKFLMPLAFACILGGMNTAIGTPPNIIISEYKATISSTGTGFNFFDYSYVGIVITIISILFIAFSFIRATKSSSVPDKPSARAIHASFPETIMIPLSKSKTEILSLSIINIDE